jgi:hypothetical protein
MDLCLLVYYSMRRSTSEAFAPRAVHPREGLY